MKPNPPNHPFEVTITRKNIEAAQLSQAKQQLEPLTPEGIVLKFIPRGCDEPRHYRRVRQLMVS